MSYGPIAIANVRTSNLGSPGMPIIVEIHQVNNDIIQATIAIPSMDSDGGNLSQLSKLTVATTVVKDRIMPFKDKNMIEILAQPSVQKVDVPLTLMDAGQEKIVSIPVVELGAVQTFAAACTN